MLLRIVKTAISFLVLFVCVALLSVSAKPYPFIIDRDNETYEEALTGREINRHVTSFYHPLRINPKGLEGEELIEERIAVILEHHEAGIVGPFLPMYENILGMDGYIELYEEYGIEYPYYLPFQKFSRIAKERYEYDEIVFKFPTYFSGWEHDLLACWDPAYREVTHEIFEEWLEEYGKAPWLNCVIGQDEPFNWASTVRNPGATEIVNAWMEETYDVKLKFTPQDTTMWRYYIITEPSVLNEPELDVALMRIAAFRWLNEQLVITGKPMMDMVRQYAPGKEFWAYNRNTINLNDFIEKYDYNAMDCIDQAAIYDITDGFSADPYPTMTMWIQGRPRVVYHTGFISKLITDLGAGKPSKVIMQGFQEWGLPTREGLYELTSQAAKAGARDIEWFGYARYSTPEYYEATLELSEIWNSLPALDIPDESDIAIIFSDDSRNGANDVTTDAMYMMHTILGERLGAWFTFVGENHVRKGYQSLDGYDVIILPRGCYLSREFCGELADAVENSGAHLVILDPNAFIHDIETGPLADFRTKFVGTGFGEPREVSHMLPNDAGSERFPGVEHIVIDGHQRKIEAITVEPPDDATVYMTWEDGSTPAMFGRPLGEGEVLFFTAQPFGNSSRALIKTEWDELLTAILDEHDIERGLPVWDFVIPMPEE